MKMLFSIKKASEVSKQDLICAFDIYTKTVDKFSETSTNEINDYITTDKSKENREMFFYVLYLNNKVYGFSEYAYLVRSKTLLIDYLCTKDRNHTLFFVFYHIIYSEIKEELSKKGQFVDHIVTELSLFNDNNKLIDVDSNYFRQILSFEKFHIIKIPYKQPYRSSNGIEFYDFNLAIKKVESYNEHSYKYNKKFYMELISEIYEEHYLQWFSNYTDDKGKFVLRQEFQKTIDKIQKEYPDDLNAIEIDSVNCPLFNRGLCNQLNPEAITISGLKENRIKNTLSKVIWFAFGIISLFLSLFQNVLGITNYITAITTFISLIGGGMTFSSYFSNLFNNFYNGIMRKRV